MLTLPFLLPSTPSRPTPASAPRAAERKGAPASALLTTRIRQLTLARQPVRPQLARYRAELLEGSTAKGGKAGEGFDVSKSGYGRAVLIGFPSVGKSTLLSKVTKTESAAAAYAFTTLVAVPGGACLSLLLAVKSCRSVVADAPALDPSLSLAVMDIEGAQIQRASLLSFAPHIPRSNS